MIIYCYINVYLKSFDLLEKWTNMWFMMLKLPYWKIIMAVLIIDKSLFWFIIIGLFKLLGTGHYFGVVILNNGLVFKYW